MSLIHDAHDAFAFDEDIAPLSSDEEEVCDGQSHPRGVRTLLPRGVQPTCIAITPDDVHLVVGCWPNTLKIYRLSDGRLVRTIGFQVFSAMSRPNINDATPTTTYKDAARTSKRSNYLALHEHERDADEDVYYCMESHDAPPKPKPNHHKGEIVNLVVSNTRIVSVAKHAATHQTADFIPWRAARSRSPLRARASQLLAPLGRVPQARRASSDAAASPLRSAEPGRDDEASAARRRAPRHDQAVGPPQRPLCQGSG